MQRHDALTSSGLLVLRLGVGAMMLLLHGWGKLMMYGDLAGRFPDPLGLGSQVSLTLAVAAEVGCALLIAIGLGTRLAAVPLLITMVVAAFIVHAGDPWAKKELALLYAAPLVTLMLTGPGRWSLDELIARRRGMR